ncbi:MAG: SDR family oxidoreductase [Chromatiales bacterium]|jgi:NAD(P)-dependent dehydrogenase (short-subunit alcohol dehydrogenase family)|nr:SDR family oxidoreductase [Chromatiales bacterium]
MYDLSGKVAVVTGAGRHGGIGEAIARRLVAEGAKVVMTDIGAPKGERFGAEHIGTAAELQSIVDDINAGGDEAVAAVCDVRNEVQVQGAIDTAVDRFGSLDVMVNNAGVGYIMNSTLKLMQDDWDAVLEVNLRGAFFGIKHAAKTMIAQGGGGRIISIASQAAKRGFPDLAAYVASKHALVGLTRTAALEFGSHDITVNTVCPNHITTGLGARQNEFRAKSLGISVEELLATRAKQIPLGRVGRTGDIASTCAFLCSTEADYITGQNLDVSGGQEMH